MQVYEVTSSQSRWRRGGRTHQTKLKRIDGMRKCSDMSSRRGKRCQEGDDSSGQPRGVNVLLAVNKESAFQLPSHAQQSP